MRRSLPFLRQGPKPLRSPLELADLAFWYDPFDTSSMVIDGSSRVALWADKSPWSRVNCFVKPVDSASADASTPDSAAVSITGNLSASIDYAAVNWSTESGYLLTKADDFATAFSYVIALNSGFIRVVFSSSGAYNVAAAAVQSSAAIPGLVNFEFMCIGVSWNQAASEIKFWYAPTGTTTHPGGTGWTQLGTTRTLTLASIFNSTSSLRVGGGVAGLNAGALGNYKRVSLWASDDGTNLVFDPDFKTVTKLATSFTESSVNAATVTINTSGATGARIAGARDLYQGTVANQPVYSVVDGVPRITTDGVDDALKSPQFPFVQPCIVQNVVSQLSWTANRYLYDGNANDSLGIYQDTSTPRIRQFAGGGGAFTTSLPLGSFGVLTSGFNGASSFLRVNEAAAATGSAGTNVPNGFTLGARGAGGNNANAAYGEQVGRASLAAMSTYEQARVIRYLARRARIGV